LSRGRKGRPASLAIKPLNARAGSATRDGFGKSWGGVVRAGRSAPRAGSSVGRASSSNHSTRGQGMHKYGFGKSCCGVVRAGHSAPRAGSSVGRASPSNHSTRGPSAQRPSVRGPLLGNILISLARSALRLRAVAARRSTWSAAFLTSRRTASRWCSRSPSLAAWPPAGRCQDVLQERASHGRSLRGRPAR